MTTPPKVSLYRRSRRDSVLAQQQGEGVDAARQAASAARATAQDDRAARAMRAANDPAPRPPSDTPSSGPAASGTADLAAAMAEVRAEGLTGRQLRLARRIAAMHGIDVDSDEEAVVRLRERGVDPFHRSSLSQVVAQAGQQHAQRPATGSEVALRAETGGVPTAPRPIGQIQPRQMPAAPGAAPANLPPGPPLPSREALTEEKRAAEIIRIQRDIARRRRIRLFWLSVRLFLLVGLPSILAAWYYYSVATPLYEAQSQFQIQQADSAAVAAGSSILSGIQLNPDSVAVQSYLASMNAMQRLDAEMGFKSAFQDPSVDPLLRLPPQVSDVEAYKLYSDMVKIGYDPTEGVINMDVAAPDPELAREYSSALLRYAEGMVDEMTLRVRGDQMKGAEDNYALAESRVAAAQERVQDLQTQLGVLDPQAEGGLVMGQISALESELTKKRLELAQLQSNPSPNAARVQGVQGDIARIQGLIEETRAQLTVDSNMRDSLARISGQLRIAEADLETRQALLAAAAEQLELARIEANKQVRYLSLSVAPVAPDRPAYPKAFVNSLVAFLIFLGIYLMMSLTASILREQVST